MPFVREETGIETVEYAVMAALIIGTLVVVLVSLAGSVRDAYQGLIDILAA